MSDTNQDKRKRGQEQDMGVAGECAHAPEGRSYVAVYGTLMAGEHNARWRYGIRTIETGRMRGRLFDTGCGFPAFVPADDGDADWVACEILECTPEQIAHMDVLEGYPRMYRRELVRVQCDGGADVEAICYVMNRLPLMARRIEPDATAVVPVADWREYRARCYSWM